jgi:glucose/arabinose dehydrogenase
VALVALTATALVASACGSAGSNPDLVAIGAGLRGPSTLTATQYATGLLHVSALTFDPKGRLWAATADSTDSGADAVYLVAAAGATPVKIIAGVHTPLGLLWYQGSLYVASAGHVDAYRGLSGTRFANHTNIITLPTGVGESNALVIGPDGRMSMGISAPCDHCTPASKWAAAVVSFQPDGSDLRVDASGIRAPVGLTYFPQTSDLFVTINQRDDLAGRTPGDWLAVVEPGQHWGYPACYGQGGKPCAGTPRPTAALDKHAGVSDVAIATGQLGPAVGTAALVTEWAFGKVQRVALRRVGTTYTAKVSPFLVGFKNPVGVVIAPDGAVLVGDWGAGTVDRIAVAS